nr:protein argonaute 4-like [Tanacetum cinerariifolium]
MDFDNGNGGPVDALPPPPLIPEDVVPIKAELVPAKKKVMLVPMARRGLGTKAHPQSSDHMAADRNLFLLDVYIPDLSTLIHDIIPPSLDL